MNPDILDAIEQEIARENARIPKRKLTRAEKRRERLYPWLWTLGGFVFLAMCFWAGGWYS